MVGLSYVFQNIFRTEFVRVGYMNPRALEELKEGQRVSQQSLRMAAASKPTGNSTCWKNISPSWRKSFWRQERWVIVKIDSCNSPIQLKKR